MCADKIPPPRLIPSTRFTLAILVSLALFVQYSQRLSLSMAIVCMVDRTNINNGSKSTAYSAQFDNKTVTKLSKYGTQFFKDKQFPWSEFQQQILLGAYWFGYIFTLVPSGWLSVVLGAKRMFAGSILLSSIATLGISCIYFMNNFSFYLALIFRVVIGFTHGPLFPATYTFWSKWAVPLERATLTSIGFCSNNLGTSITMLVGGLLCRYVSSGWIYIFVLTSIFGFIWLPLWLCLVADSPHSHKTISEKEKNYICDTLGISLADSKNTSMPLSKLPWMKFVRSKPIIALFVTECCNLFGLFFFYTNVGKILTEVHRVPTQYAGYVLAGGFILMPISCVGSGVIADRLDAAKKMSLTNIRKMFNSIASFVPAGCMIVLCFCDHTRQILGVITILIFLITSAMAYGSGYIVNFSDVIPVYSSVVFGITTAAATVGALISNIIAGLVIKSPVLEDWRKLFILFAIIYFIGGLVYALFGSAEPREWAIRKTQEKKEVDDQIPGEATVLMDPLGATKAREWTIRKTQEKQEVDDQIPGEATVLMQPLGATKAPEI